MANDQLNLYYRNEDDRAYGLAGMAISVASLDALDKIVAFSLDSEDTMVEFTSEYYYGGSPAVSPKATWDTIVSNYFMTMSMVISNVMSRAMVRDKQGIPEKLLEEIHKEILREGAESCELEKDEIEELYLQSLTRSRRIFQNPRLHPAIDELAHIFSRRRRLTGRDMFDELRLLQLL